MGKYLRAYDGLPYVILMALMCFGVAQCAHAAEVTIVCKEFKPGEISCIIAGTVSDVTPPSDKI